MKKNNLFQKEIIVGLIVALLFTCFAPTINGNKLRSSKSETLPINNFTKNTGYTFDVTIPPLIKRNIEASDGNNYLLYELENNPGFITESGKPKLPYMAYKVSIPSDAENIKVNVINFEDKTEIIAFPIYPAEKQILVKDELLGTNYVKDEFFKDVNFYETSVDFYPEVPVDISELGNLRGLRYAVIAVYPIQYKPHDRTLKLNNHLRIQMTWKSTKDNTPGYLGTTFEKIIEQTDILNIKREITTNPQQSLMSSGQVSYPPDLADTSNKAEYLIISANEFYESALLASFAQHRADFNEFNVAVVRTDDIYAAIGSSIPEDPQLVDTLTDRDLKIKTFIKYVYEQWDNGAKTLEYVLLVGDADTDTANYYLPSHLSTSIVFSSNIVTDYWFSCINDDNEDGVIDDDDRVGDIIIGRFSIQTIEDLSAVASKTINYELNPPVYPEEDWGSKVLMTSGFYGPEAGMNNMPYMRDRYMFPNRFEITELYATEYEDHELMKEDMMAEIGRGHAIFAHNGHGQTNAWSLGWYPGCGGGHAMFWAYYTNLLNNNDKLPIIFSIACETGRFDEDYQCLGERFVNVDDKGAIAFLGASRPTTLGDAIALLKETLTIIANREDFILGRSIFEAKLGISLINSARLLFNLLGDPALDMSQVLKESYKPELTCHINGYINQGDHVTFYTTVKNSGVSNANNVKVELFLKNKLKGDTLIEESTCYVSLQAETEKILEIKFRSNEEWDGQSFYPVIDGSNQIDEIYEENNFGEEFDYSYDFYTHFLIGNGSHPDMHNHKIVWDDTTDSNTDIYLYDLGPDYIYGTYDDSEVIRLTTDLSLQKNPSIHKNKIVWQSKLDDDNDIYYYDLGDDGKYGTSDDSGEIRIITDMDSVNLPEIYDNIIVWQGQKEDVFNIYFYDLGQDGIYGTADDSGILQITQDILCQDNPVIYENKIIWVGSNSSGNDFNNKSGGEGEIGLAIKNIFLYDFGPDGQYGTPDDSGIIQITKNGSIHTSPSIYKTKIVWQNSTKNNYDVFFYDFGLDGEYGTIDDSGEIRITKNQIPQLDPFIFENKIVWIENRNETSHIYLYDLGRDGQYGTPDDSGEIQITNCSYIQSDISIFKNRIIYKSYEQNREKIYLIHLEKDSSEPNSGQIPDNDKPEIPIKPVGQRWGSILQSYAFSTVTTDPDEDPIYYKWDWGDGTYSKWLGPFTSGSEVHASHCWQLPNGYKIKVKAKDIYGKQSSWSESHTISIRGSNIWGT
jgi:beta propeller repeat protein